VLIDEVDAITQATGLPPLKYAACKLAASRGDEAQMQAYPDHLLKNAAARGEGSAFGLYWAPSLMHNSYDVWKALEAAAGCEHGRHDVRLGPRRAGRAWRHDGQRMRPPAPTV
jgi:hypothetical protein